MYNFIQNKTRSQICKISNINVENLSRLIIDTIGNVDQNEDGQSIKIEQEKTEAFYITKVSMFLNSFSLSKNTLFEN